MVQISEAEFNWIENSSYMGLARKIIERKSTYMKYYVEETINIVKSNPFSFRTIDLLVNEGWKVEDGSWINSCNQEKKIMKLEKNLISKPLFYERDITFMHELNHAYYGRFKILGRDCLDDSVNALHEFESRLINEFISRNNRSNSPILQSAIESFGLKPQIYDLASYLAFEKNSEAEKSKLAMEKPELLNTILKNSPNLFSNKHMI